MKRLFLSVLMVVHGGALCAQKDDRTLRPQQASVQAAAAEARVALVIGNSAYDGAFLKNPVNDARGMKEALTSCKFEVTLLTDASKQQMEEAIAAFGQRIRGGAVGLFYYAGHGLQVKGDNYLIPIGAKLDQEDEVRYRAVNVGQVLDKMEAAKNKLNILILDACRNNPFARSWHRGEGEKGLASVNAPRGSLISYATAPGSTAADGSGEHGLYTEALLAEINEPGQRVEEVFKKVRAKVLEGSGGQQLPFESTSVVGDFYFRPIVAPVGGPTEAELEATYWEGVKDSRRASDYETFLGRFPRGNFAELAKAKLANLRRASENTVVVNNLAEPWKALQRDKLETKEEFAQRVAALGAVRVGGATISVDNYDVDSRKLTLPYQPDLWAKPYLRAGRIVLELDRAQLRQLVAAGGTGTLAARFEVREGRPQATGLVVNTAVGAFPVGAEPPPVAGAMRNAVDLWETTTRVGNASLPLVQIPAGSFQMGTPGNTGDERQHPVSLSRDVWIGKFPVTQGQWQAVMGNNPSNFKNAGADAPVEQVSWDDAQQFLAKLNGLQGQFTFRLPTEAEWEYACRAGTEGVRYGDLDAIAWYDQNSGKTTHPVGQKQPNAFGLYDMNGNVWQWCQDWYGDGYYSQSPSTDPQGPASGQYRVCRGGSWNNHATYVRSASRGLFTPDFRFSRLGLRVCAVARTQ